MFDLFMKALRPNKDMRLLDVGVTSDTKYQESNYFEKMYPNPAQITCVGTEDGSHLEREYPGIRYLKVQPGEPLPFQTNEFDLVFSNAVIEHVGDRQSQASFASEICRVGKQFFVTTPNRWFPVEHHTGIPLLPFLPAPLFRALIRNTRYRYWASVQTLNLLTTRELAALFPSGVSVTIEKIRIAGLSSNLVAYGSKTP
jgi:SAM-dependent methyltransferase